MAQNVVYADLKFAAGPSSTVPDDDDSPYENVPLGPATAEPSPGGIPAAAAAAGTPRLRVASIPFPLASPGQSPPAARYSYPTLPSKSHAPGRAPCPCLSSPTLPPDWQVSRSMQDTSREHKAEQGRLSQELRALEQSLEQTQLELARAREQLQRAWQDGNITQVQLKSRNAELGNTQKELAVLQEEMQMVQARLNASESTVSSLRACMNSDCCPRGWVLFRSKCLYISVTKKTWLESYQDCYAKSAQLLAQDIRPTLTVPVRSRGAVVPQEGGAGQSPVQSAPIFFVTPRLPAVQDLSFAYFWSWGDDTLMSSTCPFWGDL
uniref:Autophagy-related protein 16 domain-containing protein n=1 Tax=Cyanoderma ruficeps TaxID=181631 RepID=A0A8C3P179_9PASS